MAQRFSLDLEWGGCWARRPDGIFGGVIGHVARRALSAKQNSEMWLDGNRAKPELRSEVHHHMCWRRSGTEWRQRTRMDPGGKQTQETSNKRKDENSAVGLNFNPKNTSWFLKGKEGVMGRYQWRMRSCDRNTRGRHLRNKCDAKVQLISVSTISGESKIDPKARNRQVIVKPNLENGNGWVNIVL